MVITGHSGVYAINGLSETELNVILGIVSTADRRCFDRQNTSDGLWYSGDDFVLRLSDEERTALSKLGEAIQMIYND